MISCGVGLLLLAALNSSGTDVNAYEIRSRTIAPQHPEVVRYKVNRDYVIGDFEKRQDLGDVELKTGFDKGPGTISPQIVDGKLVVQVPGQIKDQAKTQDMAKTVEKESEAPNAFIPQAGGVDKSGAKTRTDDEQEVPVKRQKLEVFFDLSKSDLSISDQSKIIEFLIKKYSAGEEISLVGYTCPLGPVDFNKQLSLKRAESVRQILKKYDVPVSQTIGAGIAKHKGGADIPASQDRKVEIIVTKNAKGRSK
jgi:outer membrane protein OmpA-like peptidoglycan-associated protein